MYLRKAFPWLLLSVIGVLGVVACSGSPGDSSLVPPIVSAQDGSTTPSGDGGPGPTRDGGPAECAQACGENQVCSGGACVDLPKSCPCPIESYCDLASGSCKVGCTKHEECNAGRFCELDARVCKSGCRSVNECTKPANAKASCDKGKCSSACDVSFHACGATCKADDDLNACGPTCLVCPANTACAGGSCRSTINDIVLAIGTAVGATTTKTVTLSAARMMSRLSAFGACPLATASYAGDYPYQYIEVKNPTGQAAKVTVYSSLAPGGVVIDTVMAGYASAVQPVDEVGRKACRDGVNDQSSGADVAITGNADFSILKAVAIPAGGSVLIYVSTFYQYVVGGADVTTGELNIGTKVETLN